MRLYSIVFAGLCAVITLTSCVHVEQAGGRRGPGRGRPKPPKTTPGTPQEPIAYVGEDKVAEADYKDGYVDGRMRPAIGTKNFQVMRGNRSNPDLGADGLGWTYHHAPDMAYEDGKFYCAWLCNPWGEHVPPGTTLVATSTDGRTWGKPRVIFPPYAEASSGDENESMVMHQRMVFYKAPNGRFLLFAFYGVNDGHGIGRVVREMYDDETLGPIYFVRPNDNWKGDLNYPMYTESKDAGFVEACVSMLNDPVRRMQWWEEDRYAKDADDFYMTPLGRDKKEVYPGKAFSFYTRPDGVIVGLFKDRFATLSSDGGQTWSYRGKIPTLTYGGAKIWAQQTDDGRFAAVYNPTDSAAREPLAVAVSEDGIHFDNLATVHSELPIKRYWGREKRPGPQYVRGIVDGNGNAPGDELWVTYSVSKEDIWVAKVPVPIRRTWTGPVDDDFDAVAVGELPVDWNIYEPKWGKVAVAQDAGGGEHYLRFEDREPIDYVTVQRVLEAKPKQTVEFQLRRAEGNEILEIDVTDKRGERLAPLRVTAEGDVMALHPIGNDRLLGSLADGKWHTIKVEVNSTTRKCGFSMDGGTRVDQMIDAALKISEAERVIFRTGEYRMDRDVQECKSGSEETKGWDELWAEWPTEPTAYDVKGFMAHAE